MRDSILWWGSRRMCHDRGQREGRRRHSSKAAIKGRGGEIQCSSINIMEICYSSAPTPGSEVPPAVGISACGRVLSACETRKSAGGKSFCQRPAEGVECQKEKACYSISTIDTFHDRLVTSKPTLLQIVPYVTRNHISVLLVPPCRAKLRRRSLESW